MRRIAAIQMKVLPGRVKENQEKAITMTEQAAVQGAELVVLPEFWQSGYNLRSEDFYPLGESKDGPTVTTFQKVAARYGILMVVPFLENSENQLFVTAAVIENTGDLLGVYRKSFLWGNERETFTPGAREYPVFDTSLGKMGVLICYDAEFPEPARLLALQGAELIVVPSVWSLGAEPRWDIQLPARALDNTVFVMGVNTSGNGSCGKSKVVAPDGRILAEAGREEETVLIREIDFGEVEETRNRIPYIAEFDHGLTPGGPYLLKRDTEQNRGA